jgi:hypothetical protein
VERAGEPLLTLSKYLLGVAQMQKGDYINLGAGAECGIYRSGFIGDLIQIDGEPIHYEVDRDYVLPMTLKLSLNGVEVYDWQPDEP